MASNTPTLTDYEESIAPWNEEFEEECDSDFLDSYDDWRLHKWIR